MPWEETEEYIRSGHRSSDDFEKDSLRTITLSEEEGIKAVVGKPKGKDTTEIQSYLFAKDKGWTLDKAKAWFEQHKPVKEHVHAVLPFQVVEKIVDKPLRIRGVAMTAGMSRNFNIYTPEELQTFASKLVSAPVYVEHVAVSSAVGKVTKTEWDGQALWYEAEIYESEVADKIRKGLVQHVSVGADYETLDVVDGKIPHGLHNAELSLVAVPGIPETNIQVLERLRESLRAKGPVKIKEQNGDVVCAVCGAPADFLVSICTKCLDKAGGVAEQFDPLVAGEYYLGFYQDPALFLPEHFRTVWLDQANGVLAVIAKARADPTKEASQSILFLKSKWQPNTIRDWLAIHPDYSAPASVTARPSTQSGVESLKEEELKKLIEDGVKEGLKKAGIIEAEWDTEYINNLPDECFAFIEAGGQKDEQGKTTPRSLRHLPFKDAQGNLNADHVRNALARLDQTNISAEGKAQATKKLCAAAAELKIESAVCGLTNETEALRTKLSETETKLVDTTTKLGEANKTIEDLRKQLPGGGLLVDPPKVMLVSEALSMVKEVLPNSMVQRSWGLGAQRMCQDLRRVIQKLEAKAGV